MIVEKVTWVTTVPLVLALAAGNLTGGAGIEALPSFAQRDW